MGFIDFTNGEVLTADQMDTVMRQGIMRFADATARDTALSEVLAEGMMAYLDDTNEVLKYDGTDWIDISGDITGVTAGTALTGGGTSGNVTLDVDLTEVQPNVITTQGDLIIGDASGDPVRLPVGSADQVLTSDGTTVSFQDASGGGGELYAAGEHTVSKDAGYYLVDLKGSGNFNAGTASLSEGIKNLSAFTSLSVGTGIGTNWTSRTSGISGLIRNVAYGDGLFVAVADLIIISSPDGITWTQRSKDGQKKLEAITYADGLFVAGGEDFAIETSPDGITWTERVASQASGTMESLVYGNGLYVGVGSNGSIFSSTDGITWASRSSGTTDTIYGVGYGNGQFIAVGNGGLIRTSPNAITWTSRSSGTTERLRDVAFNGENLVVVVGLSGTILTSNDGTSFTSRNSGTTTNLSAVAFGSGTFIACNSGGEVILSSDGISWSGLITASASNITGAVFNNNVFVVVGANGEISTSEAEIIDPNAALLLTELPDPIQP